jgi:hypothetical protein
VNLMEFLRKVVDPVDEDQVVEGAGIGATIIERVAWLPEREANGRIGGRGRGGRKPLGLMVERELVN